MGLACAAALCSTQLCLDRFGIECSQHCAATSASQVVPKASQSDVAAWRAEGAESLRALRCWHSELNGGLALPIADEETRSLPDAMHLAERATTAAALWSAPCESGWVSKRACSDTSAAWSVSAHCSGTSSDSQTQVSGQRKPHSQQAGA